MSTFVVFSTFLVYIGWGLLTIVTFAVPLFFLGYIWKQDDFYKGEQPWLKRGVGRVQALFRSKDLAKKQDQNKIHDKRAGLAAKRADAELSEVKNLRYLHRGTKHV